MASTLPVVVARKRADGVPLARSQGATVILMDDGFQNPAVAKDASLIVIDGNRGLGNGQVLPAGPLRAPLKPQLARTDALVVVGSGTAGEVVASAIRRDSLRPSNPAASRWRGGGRSPTIIRSRQARSKAWSRKPRAMV